MTNSVALHVFYPFVAGFGGIERLIADLSCFLHERGQILRLLTFENRIDFAQYGAQSLEVVSIPSPRNLLAEARQLRRVVRTAGIPSASILVMEMRGAAYAGLSLRPGYSLHIADPPSLLPRDRSKSSFTLARNYSPESSGRGLVSRVRGEVDYRLTRYGIRQASVAITMTQRNADELLAAFGVRFHKVAPGIRLPDRVVRTPPTDGMVRFLSVCRLEPSKRIDSIIEAFAEIVHSGEQNSHNLRLRIVGEGSQRRQLEELARSTGVAPFVEFTGRVSDEELEKAYSDSDVFVMPARQGYGLPGLESLARGLQLVVHRESGVSEYLADFRQVQVIEDSRSSLVAAMQRAASEHNVGLPRVQTSDEWSGDITRLCGWCQ
jgi:glycosyltransferase involved in cell wall biosynthesis